MEPNKQLSIVIPTYNRGEFLDYSLGIHIALVKQYNIQIYIFDNASTDHTKEVVLKWMQKYPHLSYHKSETNIGPDANFERALRHPDSDYIWLLGDTYQLPEDGIAYLLELSKNKKYDAMVFNLENKLKLPKKNYNDANILLQDFGALMTCLSCLVYSKELLKRANFSRYYNSYFIQTGIIFEDIANKDFFIHWTQEQSIKMLEHPHLKKTNWSQTPKAFEIGCEYWTNFVMSLPQSYSLENKIKCIMDFGKISGLFTLKNLILLRMKGLLNIQIFNKYKKLFLFTIDYPLSMIFILCRTPKILLKLFGILAVIILKKDKLTKLQTIAKG